MKKLLSCAALICAVALVGCSKGNKAEENAAQLDPATMVVGETQIVDQNGNVVATVVDGKYVDAEGNVIGTVEAVQARFDAAKDSIAAISGNVADKAKEMVDDAKDAVTNAKDSIADKASELAGKATDAASKAADDLKAGVADKLNEAGAALQNQANKLDK